MTIEVDLAPVEAGIRRRIANMLRLDNYSTIVTDIDRAALVAAQEAIRALDVVGIVRSVVAEEGPRIVRETTERILRGRAEKAARAAAREATE